MPGVICNLGFRQRAVTSTPTLDVTIGPLRNENCVETKDLLSLTYGEDGREHLRRFSDRQKHLSKSISGRSLLSHF